MKRILSIFLAVLMLGTGIPCLQVGTAAASGRTFWATVGDNNTHLKPEDYERALRRFNTGYEEEVHSWSGNSWKNDHVNSRIDIITLDETIPQVEIATGDLVSAKGGVIKKENFTATYLGLVHTKTPSYPGIDYDVFDVITHETVKDLEAGQLHEIWVDIYVPADTPAGVYSGKLSLKSGSQTLTEFTYKVDVADMTLTDPEDWETYLDLWEYPYASNRYYSGLSNKDYFQFTTEEDKDTNPDSLYKIRLDKRYEKGLESELELYHKAGGNAITVTLVEDPWNSRKPCPCPSMVKWIKHTDGTFSYDYTDMDYWIELNLKHKIDRQINFFYHANVGWGFVYLDESDGEIKHDGGGGAGSARWKQITQDFLQDLVNHLEEKGWFDIACLSMDERRLEVTRALVEAAENVKNSEGKPLKVGGAVNANEVAELYDRMWDISLWENLANSETTALAESRKEKGLRTTLYSCGAGKMSTPNEPAEAAYAVYDAYRYGVDGIMRWALNKYDEEPIHGENHPVPYPGDSYLIYPAEREDADMRAQSTPRFEKLCEGMREVEKLRILKKDYPEINTIIPEKNAVSCMEKLHKRVNSLTKGALSSAEQFDDLDTTEWYMPAVNFALKNGYLVGVADKEFSPDGSMTRAMFVTILSRLEIAKVDNNKSSKFTDVPKGEWYTGAVVWANQMGIVYGTSNTEFSPNQTVTREQVATMLFRYARFRRYNTSQRADITSFNDYSEIEDYAVNSISWANAVGIMNGVSSTSLAPQKDCTRAEASQLFRKFCDYIN